MGKTDIQKKIRKAISFGKKKQRRPEENGICRYRNGMKKRIKCKVIKGTAQTRS